MLERLPASELSDEAVGAVAAANAPSSANPFVTREDLSGTEGHVYVDFGYTVSAVRADEGLFCVDAPLADLEAGIGGGRRIKIGSRKFLVLSLAADPEEEQRTWLQVEGADLLGDDVDQAVYAALNDNILP